MPAPIRTPIVDEGGNLTPEWQRYYAQQQSAAATGTPPSADAPGTPRSPVLTGSETADTFSLDLSWTLPATLGGTIGYETELRFFQDSACATPDSNWSWNVVQNDAGTVSALRGPLPKWSTSDKWVKFRVRAFNALAEVSAWSDISAETAYKITGMVSTGGPTAPTQPTGSDWSIGDPASDDYRANAGNIQFVRLKPTLINMPADASWVEFFLYKGSSRPSDPGDWQSLSWAAITGGTEAWVDQPTDAETWVVCCTAHNPDWYSLPNASTPIKSVNVAAWKRALVVGLTGTPITTRADASGALYYSSDSSVDVETFNNAGSIKGRAVLSPVLPSDVNRQAYRLYTRWTQASWAAPKSDWFLAFGPVVSPWKQSDSDWDYPADEWQEHQWRSLGHDNVETTLGTLVQTHKWGGGAVDATKLNPATLGKGLVKLATGVGPSSNSPELLFNGDFEADSKDWDIATSAGVITIGTAAPYSGTKNLRIDCTLGGGTISQTLKCSPERIYKLSAYCKTTVDSIAVLFIDGYAGFSFVSGASNSITGSSYSLHTCFFTVPAAVNSIQVGFRTSGGTAVADVDNCLLETLEPTVAAEIQRDTSGSISFTPGSLGILSKYPNDKRPVLSGGAPSNSDGNPNGSYWINTGTGRIYKKISGAYKGLDAEDVVAGTFIGTKMFLSLNGVDTTIDNTLVPWWAGGVGSGYAGVLVRPTAGGDFSMVGSGLLYCGNTGGSWPILSMSRQEVTFMDSASSIAARLSVNGLEIGGAGVIRARQSTPGNSPGQTTLGLASDIGTTTPGATYGATEQGILDACRGRIYYLNPAVRELQTKYNSLETVFAALLTKLRYHGMIG